MLLSELRFQARVQDVLGPSNVCAQPRATFARRLQRVVGRDLPRETLMPHMDSRSSPRTTEKQDVAIAVLELETTQAVMGVLQWFGELDIARSKFGL